MVVVGNMLVVQNNLCECFVQFTMCVLFSYGVEVVVCSLSSLPSSHPPVSPDVFSLLFFAFFVYFIHCSQL